MARSDVIQAEYRPIARRPHPVVGNEVCTGRPAFNGGLNPMINDHPRHYGSKEPGKHLQLPAWVGRLAMALVHRSTSLFVPAYRLVALSIDSPDAKVERPLYRVEVGEEVSLTAVLEV